MLRIVVCFRMGTFLSHSTNLFTILLSIPFSHVSFSSSKRLRNKIAGFVTHLMKRIRHGPVRGISYKLQEEERERKDNYVPEVSALAVESIEIDPDTQVYE
jgi:hypothetical protein